MIIASKLIGFDVSKNPLFTPSDGFRSWQRKLKTGGWKILINKEEVSMEFLNPISVLVICSPHAKYSELEFGFIRRYLMNGGHLIFMSSEGGEKRSGTNMNFLMEEFGISVNSDSVVRTSYYKYFHPKESLITDGVLNRSIVTLAKSLRTSLMVDNHDVRSGSGMSRNRPVSSKVRSAQNKSISSSSDPIMKSEADQVSFVYPFGSTLSVIHPAIAVFSTGSVSLPINRPIVAFASAENRLRTTSSSTDSLNMDDLDQDTKKSGQNKKNPGKIVIMGSSHVFHDAYIEKEENSLLIEIIFHYFKSSGDEFVLNPIDAKDPEVSDDIPVPDLETLSEEPFSCLYEGESLPSDFTKLFSKTLYSLDNSCLALIHSSYDEMAMEFEPLKLIKPAFETPLPQLTPAVFPANFRIPSKPKLELYDLDDAFSSTTTRLIQIANKCSDSDLEYFIKESAILLGIQDSLKKSAPLILFDVFNQIVEYKKVNMRDPDDDVDSQNGAQRY